MHNIKSTIIKSQPAPPAALETGDDDPLGRLIATSFVLADIVYQPLDHVQATLEAAGYRDVECFECHRFGVQAIGCRQGDVAHLVIRGSDEAIDWLVDLCAVPWFRPLRHLGFGHCWRRIEVPVRAWLDQLGPEAKALRLIGHSLGGAVALVAAMDLAKLYPIDVVVTFGAPRMAFGGTAEQYDRLPIAGDENSRLGDATHTVVHHRDLVTRLPGWPFEEVGRLLYIDVSGKLQRGEAARRHRHATSLRDMTGLFPDLHAPILEPTPVFGTAAERQDRVEAGLRAIWRWSGVVPYLRNALMVLFLWVAFWWQLVRSGRDHLVAHYALTLRGHSDVVAYPRDWRSLSSRSSGLFVLTVAVVPLALFVGGCWLMIRWIVWPTIRALLGLGEGGL